MIQVIVRYRKKLLVALAPLALAAVLLATVEVEGALCGTCWNNDDATCIIDGIKVDEACDSATAGCYPPQH